MSKSCGQSPSNPKSSSSRSSSYSCSEDDFDDDSSSGSIYSSSSNSPNSLTETNRTEAYNFEIKDLNTIFGNINLNEVESRHIFSKNTNIGNIEKRKAEDGSIIIQGFIKDKAYHDYLIREYMGSIFTRLFSGSKAYFAQDKILMYKNHHLLVSKKIMNYVELSHLIKSHNNVPHRYSTLPMYFITDFFKPDLKIWYKDNFYTIDFDSVAVVMLYILLTHDIDGIGYAMQNLGFVIDHKNNKLYAAKIDYEYAFPLKCNSLNDEIFLYDTPADEFGHPSYFHYLKEIPNWIIYNEKGEPSFNPQAKFPTFINTCPPQESVIGKFIAIEHEKFPGTLRVNFFDILSNIPSESVAKAINIASSIKQYHINSLYHSILTHFEVLYDEKNTDPQTRKLGIDCINTYTQMFSHHLDIFKNSVKNIDNVEMGFRVKYLDSQALSIQRLSYPLNSHRIDHDNSKDPEVKKLSILKSGI